MKNRTAPLPSEAALPSRNMPKSRTAVREAAPDRRLAILLAAEKLFALRGYHAVSIRDIAGEANVQLALVNYHFGAKHELYRAIFVSWQGLIDQRLDALRRATAEPQAPDLLERIVDAFVSPVLALQSSDEGRYFAMMSARDLADPSPDADQLQREFFDPMASAFIDALLLASPGATRAQVAWCYQFSLGAMLHRLLSAERAARLGQADKSSSDPDAKALLLRFIAAGFRGALASAKTKPPPRSR